MSDSSKVIYAESPELGLYLVIKSSKGRKEWYRISPVKAALVLAVPISLVLLFAMSTVPQTSGYITGWYKDVSAGEMGKTSDQLNLVADREIRESAADSMVASGADQGVSRQEDFADSGADDFARNVRISSSGDKMELDFLQVKTSPGEFETGYITVFYHTKSGEKVQLDKITFRIARQKQRTFSLVNQSAREINSFTIERRTNETNSTSSRTIILRQDAQAKR